MAPPPEDNNGGEPTAGDAARSLPTPFLTKTYQLVDDRSLDDVISWNEDGSTFVVWNPTEFSRDLLPKYFKHNNFSSFVRQLNTYGFRKIMPDRWEFSNEFFRRGEKRLLCDINRRKATAPAVAAVAVPAVAPPGPPVGTVSSSNSGEEQVISSNSSPPTSFGSTTEIMNENERLRRENRELNKELSQMKNLCSNIYAMTSNYSGNRPESSSQAAKPLDLMPAARQFDDDNRSEPKDQTGARLFGFSIGAKRSREGEDLESEEPLSSEEEEAAVQRDNLQLQLGGAKVKSEPSDCPNGSDDQWLRKFNRANHRNGE